MGHTRGSTLAKWSWPIPTSCIAGCDLEWRWTVHIYVRVSNPYINTCSKLRMKAIDSNIQWNCTWYNGECITNSILQMNHWVQYLFPCFAMICSLLAAEHTSLWSLHTPVLSANGAINLNHNTINLKYTLYRWDTLLHYIQPTFNTITPWSQNNHQCAMAKCFLKITNILQN